MRQSASRRAGSSDDAGSEQDGGAVGDRPVMAKGRDAGMRSGFQVGRRALSGSVRRISSERGAPGSA